MFNTAVKSLLARTPIWAATRPIRRSGLVVLTYHRIGPGPAPSNFTPLRAFGDQMRWLREHCNIIAPAALEAGPDALLDSNDGRLSVLVTFDDGYRDYHDRAYPVLHELQIPAINFLPTHFIDRPEPFWWDLLEFAVANAKTSDAQLPGSATRVALDVPGKREFLRTAKVLLKQIPAPQSSEQLRDILTELGGSRDSLRLERQAMTWDEAREVGRLTTFGSHGHTHALLSGLGKGERERELSTSRDRIQAETGQVCLFLAYPNGAHDGPTREDAARAGYALGFTTEKGFNSKATHPLNMKRIYAPGSLADLVWVLTGWATPRRR